MAVETVVVGQVNKRERVQVRSVVWSAYFRPKKGGGMEWRNDPLPPMRKCVIKGHSDTMEGILPGVACACRSVLPVL